MNDIEGKLHFDKEFFNTEERDGFVVTGLMKRAWASQLNVLYVFDRICREYNLDWYADWGTLLGAVRHKGFIPWDDDIDICMKRRDYDIVMGILSDELPEKYLVMKPGSKEGLHNTMLRIVNSHQVNFDYDFLEENYGCPYSCGIDIFPLDIIPSDPEEWTLLQGIIEIILNIDAMYEKNKDINEIEDLLSSVEEMCGVTINRNEELHHQLLLLVDALATSYSTDDSERMVNVWQYALGGGEQPLECSWYDEKIYLPFENIMIPVPKIYDKVLESLFGKEYMTPIKGTSLHEYPFYNAQKNEAHVNIGSVKGYEDREKWVAKQLNMDVTEVFECSLEEKGENEDTYIYFCQSRTMKISIPHSVTV